MPNTTHLLWMDLETNNSKTDCHILEAGVILTDAKLNVLFEDSSVFYVASDWSKAMPEVVWDMHSKSGLIKDLAYSSNVSTVPDFDRRIDQKINNALAPDQLLSGDTRITLAGSGVSHFDSVLIRDRFPRIWKQLYGFENSEFLKPTMDMGVIRRYLQFFGPPDLNYLGTDDPFVHLTEHRALDDCRLFLSQARWLKMTLTNMRQGWSNWNDHLDALDRRDDARG